MIHTMKEQKKIPLEKMKCEIYCDFDIKWNQSTKVSSLHTSQSTNLLQIVFLP